MVEQFEGIMEGYDNKAKHVVRKSFTKSAKASGMTYTEARRTLKTATYSSKWKKATDAHAPSPMRGRRRGAVKVTDDALVAELSKHSRENCRWSIKLDKPKKH